MYVVENDLFSYYDFDVAQHLFAPATDTTHTTLIYFYLKKTTNF